jgi:NAD(P)-dependent dehydrogenase (short-subunit alcohol dehydrogenase family)
MTGSADQTPEAGSPEAPAPADGFAMAGSRVLVTGASSGIGAALARQLAGMGATVGIVGRREELLAGVLDDCRRLGPSPTSGPHRSWTVDLGDLDTAEALAVEAWDTFGGLDVLVNNAAIPKVRDVRRLSAADLDETTRVNYLSPVRMTMALLPRWLERGSGTIVNVTSLGGRIPILWESAYCASKFALTGFTEVLAMDLHETPIRVRLVIPGPFATDIWDRPGSDPAAFKDGDKFPPEVCAQGIVDAILGDAFEWYVPDMKGVAEYATSNLEHFIGNIAAMHSASRHSAQQQPEKAGD